MNRRGFLGAMLAACAAPAVVRAESIMRIKPMLLPGVDFNFQAGADATAYLQGIIDAAARGNGLTVIPSGLYTLGSTLRISNVSGLVLRGSGALLRPTPEFTDGQLIHVDGTVDGLTIQDLRFEPGVLRHRSRNDDR